MMEAEEFALLRQRLDKTQKEMSQLLGVSIRAVQSFEQGWRKVPVHVERQAFFLQAMKKKKAGKLRPCWRIQRCSLEDRRDCPAWEFQVGHLCWFINGNLCAGIPLGDWRKKMQICKKCRVFTENMEA